MTTRRKHERKPCDIFSLLYKNQHPDFIIKNLKFQIFDVAFLILFSVCCNCSPISHVIVFFYICSFIDDKLFYAYVLLDVVVL